MHCGKFVLMRIAPVLLISFLCCFTVAKAQLNPQSFAQLKQLEERIKPYANNILESEDVVDRLRADSAFTRGLVQALRTPFSFDYPFDSLTTIAKVTAPDKTFRIFTWQLMKDFTYYRQKGCIQMRTDDGSLKLFPLFDYSEFTDNPFDSVRSNMNWIGAVYYNIVQKAHNNKQFYTLFGFDNNDARSTKKWMEVLTFDEQGQPQFGGRFFNYPADSSKPAQPAYRFGIEYKKDGNARLNFDPRADAVVMDILVSESGEFSNKGTLVPYGGFEGFQWKNGRWNFVRNPYANVIFDEKQSSMPAPLLDEKGKKSEQKLKAISDKNMKKGGGNNY